MTFYFREVNYINQDDDPFKKTRIFQTTRKIKSTIFLNSFNRLLTLLVRLCFFLFLNNGLLFFTPEGRFSEKKRVNYFSRKGGEKCLGREKLDV